MRTAVCIVNHAVGARADNGYFNTFVKDSQSTNLIFNSNNRSYYNLFILSLDYRKITPNA